MKNERLDSIQVIRGMACLGVFLSHAGIKFFSACGAWGVSVFFILSGFLMVLNYYRENRFIKVSLMENIKFSVRKIKKLYFLHIIMMSVELLIRGGDKFEKIFFNIFLLQAWIPSADFYFSLNGVSWYLSVCVFLYFIFPWILRLIERYKGVRIAKFIMILTYLVQIIACYVFSEIPFHEIIREEVIHWWTYIFPLMRIGDFFIGCNLGYLFLIEYRNAEKAKIMVSNKKDKLVYVIIILQWMVHRYYSKVMVEVSNPKTWWINTIFFTLTSCWLIWEGVKKEPTRYVQSIFVRIGNISSYIFLIHLIIIRYLKIFWNQVLGIRDKGTFVLAIVSFAVTLVSVKVYIRCEDYLFDRVKSRENGKSNYNM